MLVLYLSFLIDDDDEDEDGCCVVDADVGRGGGVRFCLLSLIGFLLSLLSAAALLGVCVMNDDSYG